MLADADRVDGSNGNLRSKAEEEVRREMAEEKERREREMANREERARESRLREREMIRREVEEPLRARRGYRVIRPKVSRSKTTNSFERTETGTSKWLSEINSIEKSLQRVTTISLTWRQ